MTLGHVSWGEPEPITVPDCLVLLSHPAEFRAGPVIPHPCQQPVTITGDPLCFQELRIASVFLSFWKQEEGWWERRGEERSYFASWCEL